MSTRQLQVMNSGEAQKPDVNRTISDFSSQEGMHHRQIKCLSCEKLGGHLENCDLKHLLPVKLLFSDADQNESYPLTIVNNTQTEIPNIYESDGMVQMPNHSWMLLPRGYKWDKSQHHYMWVLSEGETKWSGVHSWVSR